MKRSWTEGVDWFWVALALMVIVPTIVGMVSDINKHNSDNQVIEACVAHGGHPVLDNGQLKDCK